MCYLGVWPAVLVGGMASLYTMFLWGHGYAVLIFTAEIAFVAWISRGGRRNFLVADFIFWVLIGVPLVVLFYGLFMELPIYAVMLIATKQSVNGLLNVFLAGLIVYGIHRSRRSATPVVEPRDMSFAMFLSVYGLVLTAGAVPIFMKGLSTVEGQEEAYRMVLRERLVWVQGLVDRSEAKDLQELSEEILIFDTDRAGMSCFLLDPDGKILLGVGEPQLLHADHPTSQDDMLLWYPTDLQVAMERWRHGSYVMSSPVAAGPVSRVVVGQSSEEVVAVVQSLVSQLLGFLAALLFAGIILAMALSRWLSEPLRRLTHMVSKASVPIVTTDAQGGITWFNPAFADFRRRRPLLVAQNS